MIEGDAITFHREFVDGLGETIGIEYIAKLVDGKLEGTGETIGLPGDLRLSQVDAAYARLLRQTSLKTNLVELRHIWIRRLSRKETLSATAKSVLNGSTAVFPENYDDRQRTSAAGPVPAC